MKTPSFPLEIKNGNSLVKIYPHSNAGYAESKVAYYAEGCSKMETYADLEKAKTRAGEINDRANDGSAVVLTLTARTG
jgi:hypothetical protein